MLPATRVTTSHSSSVCVAVRAKYSRTVSSAAKCVQAT